MWWQKASARTVATATPDVVPVPGQVEQPTHRRGTLAPLAEGARSRALRAGPRPRRSSPPGRAARGQASTCRRVSGSTARPPGRRSGRRSAARAPRTGRRSPAGPRATRRTRTSGGRMPFSRRARAAGGGAPDRPAEVARVVRGDVEVHHLATRVDPGVGAPGAGHRDGGHPQRRGQRRLELALHGAQPRLGRPAVEVGTVIGEVDPDPHGAHPASRGARAEGPAQRATVTRSGTRVTSSPFLAVTVTVRTLPASPRVTTWLAVRPTSCARRASSGSGRWCRSSGSSCPW